MKKSKLQRCILTCLGSYSMRVRVIPGLSDSKAYGYSTCLPFARRSDGPWRFNDHEEAVKWVLGPGVLLQWSNCTAVIAKKPQLRGTWVVQVVKCPTLDLGSGQDLMVREFECPYRALCWGCGAWLGFCLSFSLCPSPACALYLSKKKKKTKKKQKQKTWLKGTKSCQILRISPSWKQEGQEGPGLPREWRLPWTLWHAVREWLGNQFRVGPGKPRGRDRQA